MGSKTRQRGRHEPRKQAGEGRDHDAVLASLPFLSGPQARVPRVAMSRPRRTSAGLLGGGVGVGGALRFDMLSPWDAAGGRLSRSDNCEGLLRAREAARRRVGERGLRRLEERPSFARVLREAQPYAHLFPK